MLIFRYYSGEKSTLRMILKSVVSLIAVLTSVASLAIWTVYIWRNDSTWQRNYPVLLILFIVSHCVSYICLDQMVGEFCSILFYVCIATFLTNSIWQSRIEYIHSNIRTSSVNEM